MFSQKKKQTIISANVKDMGTVIGDGIILENVIIKGIGYVRIDGVVSGEIQLEGHLIIGETGKLTGDVHAGSALILGTYEGNINIDETLQLAQNSNVFGNVKAGNFVIEEGAAFHGTCNLDMAKLNKENKDKFFSVIRNESERKGDIVPKDGLEEAEAAL